MTPLDDRYGDRLSAAEQAARRVFGPAANQGPAHEDVPGWSIGRHEIDGVDESDAGLIRIALLRSVVESDLGTAESTPGVMRAGLARRGLRPDPELLAVELALCNAGIPLGAGVTLGWLRLPLLDPILDDLDTIDADHVTGELRTEVLRAAEMLVSDSFLYAPDQAAADRRPRLIGFLHRLEPGSLSAMAFDPGDSYGTSLRSLVETDAELAGTLLPLYRYLCTAITVLPGTRWSSDVAAIVGSPTATLRSAVVRAVRPLMDMDIRVDAGAPGMPGALRVTNQRLARGLLWVAAMIEPDWAVDALAMLALRFGTSGRPNNVARDSAIAGTCIALLGHLDTPAAVGALLRVQAGVTNRTLSKQVGTALQAHAARIDADPQDLADQGLPAFGLDETGRLVLPMGGHRATIAIDELGVVSTTWDGDPGGARAAPPGSLATAHPAETATVMALATQIEQALRDDRQRIDVELASGRSRPLRRWQQRWLAHPIGGALGRRLVWQVGHPGATVDVLPTVDGRLLDVTGHAVEPPADARVSLWHPVERSPEEVDAWRDRLAALRTVQPVKQVFREVYRAGPDQSQDRRFADRPLGYRQLRALLRSRGWAGAALGPWDLGESGSVRRTIVPDLWVAELDLTAAGRTRPDEQVSMVRSGALRILRAGAPGQVPVELDHVPPRVLSEALRDVDLFTTVADPTRRSSRLAAADPSSSIVETRAAVLRRVIPMLPFPQRLAVVGQFLRVEADGDSYLISLLDGIALSTLDERRVTPPAAQPVTERLWVPDSDDPAIEAMLSLASWLITDSRSSDARRPTS